MFVDCVVTTFGLMTDVFNCCRKRKRRRRKRRRKKKKRRRKPKILIQTLLIKCDDQMLRIFAAMFYHVLRHALERFLMTVDSIFFVCSSIQKVAFTEPF